MKFMYFIRPIALGMMMSLVLFAISDPASAVTAYPGQVAVTQPGGTKFTLRMHGDEFFSWNETSEGYAIQQDSADGFWKYARPAAGQAAFDIIPDARVGGVNPESLGLRKNDKPAGALIKSAVDASRNEAASIGPAQPAPAKAQSSAPTSQIPVSGTKTINNIVILACFDDHWDSAGGTVLSTKGRVATSEYSNLFNQAGYTTDGAVGSVRDYYREVSYGKLTVNSIVTPWVHLPSNESYYGTDGTSKDTNWKVMITDAITAAKAAGFNFAQGDSDGDGWVDCLTVIHSGFGQEWGGNPSTCVWSKQGSMPAVVTQDGVSMYRVHTEPALRGSSTSITRVGVVCHEMGHFFGLPDLYDYSDITAGLGNWCIMAGGSWNGSDGKSPSHMSAWAKYMLGFVKPVRIHTQNSILLPRVEDNPAVHMLQDGTSNGEYFLVENRSKTGFDNTSEITAGIAIYHVDSKSANNDLGTWPHPAVKLEEADGDNSLGLNVTGSEMWDIWWAVNGLAGGFRDQTGNQSCNTMLYQDTHAYNRTDNVGYYTYNRLSNFSIPGATMTYSAMTLRPTIANQTASGNYTVSWPACTNASAYELQEGTPATLTSFSDGAESEDAMYDNWSISGTVKRDNSGAKTGSYSYSMNNYYNSKWGSSVQSITMSNPFKVTASTAIGYNYLSHLSTTAGYLKCQISKDNGDTWLTLGTFNGYADPWTAASHDYTAIHALGINAGDSCIIRFVANFEMAYGWSAFPGYGFALDDIQITGTEISSYSGWTTLSNTITGTSYPVNGKTSGTFAYRARAFANVGQGSSWQGYGSIGTVTLSRVNNAKNWSGYR